MVTPGSGNLCSTSQAVSNSALEPGAEADELQEVPLTVAAQSRP